MLPKRAPERKIRLCANSPLSYLEIKDRIGLRPPFPFTKVAVVTKIRLCAERVHDRARARATALT